MFRTLFLFTFGFATTCALALSACASPHFFPRAQPLFAGLDETQLSAPARQSVQKAKVDFMLAKHGRTPSYARLAHEIPHTRSKVYQGRGYLLTIVHEDTTYPHRKGPKIVIDATVTGGKAYKYDEVDEVAD